MSHPDYILSPGVPTPGEYADLRREAGLTPMSIDAAEIGLPNTYFGVVVRDGGTLVGMGRAVGDGGLCFQIADIAVKPGYQGQGIGKRIMQSLMDHLKQNAPRGAYVSLIADGSADKLYSGFGFKHTAPASAGMAMFL